MKGIKEWWWSLLPLLFPSHPCCRNYFLCLCQLTARVQSWKSGVLPNSPFPYCFCWKSLHFCNSYLKWRQHYLPTHCTMRDHYCQQNSLRDALEICGLRAGSSFAVGQLCDACLAPWRSPLHNGRLLIWYGVSVATHTPSLSYVWLGRKTAWLPYLLYIKTITWSYWQLMQFPACSWLL